MRHPASHITPIPQCSFIIFSSTVFGLRPALPGGIYQNDKGAILQKVYDEVVVTQPRDRKGTGQRHQHMPSLRGKKRGFLRNYE